MGMWILWLIVAGFFFILEIATTGFLAMWLGVAGLITLALSFFVDNVVIQVIVFAVSSVVLILLTKPLVKKFIDKKTIPTNTDSLMGKEGIVIQTIDNIKSIGQVKLQGEVWSAKSFDDDKIIEKGTQVVVKDISGVKLVVEESEKTEEITA